ncbi:hypothetical protein [Streptomyces sp. HPF1205]|uniref:hypothetical protein n=1 Tax=Streptomyces sp. HPF1205 TaxID=2873262 RepID=UPI001CEC9819|nr:hypothetical protein [Streptomyces sp. HPF1205]
MSVDFDDDPHGRYGEELGDALRRTADDFRPDTLGLVAAGHARGRRLRRRRTALVTAAVAAVAAAGVGGALAATGGTGGTSGTGGHGSGVASASQPQPTAAAKGHGRPASKALTAEQMEHLLVSMLPAGGTVSGVTGRGTGESIPYAHVVYDDGHGKAAVEVGVTAQGEVPTCPSRNPDPTTSCTVIPLHNSAGVSGTLQIFKGYEYPDHRVATKEWVARFRTSSGAVVELDEWNSPQEKDAPITRPEPPLNSAQITGIVTNPRWQWVIDALPAPKKWRNPGAPGKSVTSNTSDRPAATTTANRPGR